MKAIILSAGKSSRFAAEGWTIPKQLLPMSDGRRLIEWQEERMFRITDDVTTVLHKSDDITKKYIRGKIAKVADSNGVLNTFLQVAHLSLTKAPIIITYVDSFMNLWEYQTLKDMSPWLDAVNVVFSSTEDRFNYPANGFADGGIFKFKSGFTILKAMMKFRPPYTDKDGFYLLVKALARKTYFVSYSFTDVGTPGDYKAFMMGHGQKVEVK